MEPVHNKTTWSANWIVLAIIAVATAAILLSLVPAAQATAGNLPPRPTRTPTPTSTPTPTPAVTPPPPGPRPAEDTAPDGASIELQIQLPPGLPISAASQLWTVVQWQDSSGRWHAVDGWQGTPDQVAGGMATKAWWLPASLFDQGPFRWAVLEQLGGQRLSTSAPFSLPSQAGETLEIEIVY
jgi:hypothetical protein